MYCRAAQAEEKGGGWNKLAQETVKRANHEMHDELNINQWLIQVRGPGEQKNQEVLHTKSTYY